MTTNFQRESAKIYTFPARGRFAADGHIEEAKSAVSRTTPRVTACGAAWYHEEAIKDAKRDDKD